MTIDPTREEWLAGRERVLALFPGNVPGATHWDKLVEAILGPCPPKPPPEPFRVGGYTLVRNAADYPGGRGKIAVPRHVLTPDEADAMAAALVKHAVYARAQGEVAEAILGPCPPEPPPVGWRSGDGGIGTLLVAPHADGGVWVGWPHVQHAQLFPDEADAMAKALIEHAAYAHKSIGEADDAARG